MSMIDTEALLNPVSAENPAGDNLEYDPAFMDLERAALWKPEQQMGGVIIPAEPPDHNAVFKQASALFPRTKDLRVANYLVQSLLYRADYEGLSEGLAVVHGLLDRYWEPLHPQLDPDDGNDPTMRVTALAGLCTPDVLARVRSAPLIRSRSFGPISLRELAIAAGQLPQVEDGPKYDENSVEAAFLEVPLEDLQAMFQTLESVSQHLRAIDATFEEKAGVRGPEFTPLLQIVRQATSAVRQRLDARQGGAETMVQEFDADAGTNGQAAAAVRVTAPALTGDIVTRDDVIRALDKICAYYSRHEPSSPLPLLLRRCKRLVPMSFAEILRDLAPDAISQVELIAGRTEE